jgi:molybdate transport system substrate-binding protein
MHDGHASASNERTHPMNTDAVKVFASMGVQGVVDGLKPSFEQTSGHRLAITYNTSKMLTQQLLGGAETDVVIGTRDHMDPLVAAGLIAAGSDVALAHSIVGMAVLKGAPKPDISSPEAFKRAVLAARAIGYSEPAGGGASGVHFEKLIHRLGIADAVKPKAKHPPVGTHTADMLLTGEVDLAVQQVAELNFVKGIELIGPLPEELQHVTIFVGAVHAKARNSAAARALLAFLRTPEGTAAFKTEGLDPV